MKSISNILIGVGITVAVLLGFCVGRKCGRNAPGEPQPSKVDTLYIRDTTIITEPQKEPTPDVLIKEIPIPVADSAAIDSLLHECTRLERVGDSLQLILLRVQRHYSDTTYDAWVSGIDPNLDSLKIYQASTIITNEIPVIQVRRSRWGIGIQAGVQLGKDGLTPGVSIGVSYTPLSW